MRVSRRLLAALVLTGSAAQAQVEDPGRRPEREEAFRLVDAYVVSHLQEGLGLSDEQFAKAVPLVSKLQRERREYLLGRVRLTREMRRLLRQGGSVEAQVLERLEESKKLEAEGPERIRRNFEALDAVLDPAAAGQVPRARGRGRAAHARAREPRARGPSRRAATRQRARLRSSRAARSAHRTRRILAAYGHQEEAGRGRLRSVEAARRGEAETGREPRAGKGAKGGESGKACRSEDRGEGAAQDQGRETQDRDAQDRRARARAAQARCPPRPRSRRAPCRG